LREGLCRIYSEEESFLFVLFDFTGGAVLRALVTLAGSAGLLKSGGSGSLSSGDALVTGSVEGGALFVEGKVGIVGAVFCLGVFALDGFNALLGLFSANFFGGKVGGEPGLGISGEEDKHGEVADLSNKVDGEVNVEAGAGELGSKGKDHNVEEDVDEGDESGNVETDHVHNDVPEADNVDEEHKGSEEGGDQVPDSVGSSN